jgi:hypothetical protein
MLDLDRERRSAVTGCGRTKSVHHTDIASENFVDDSHVASRIPIKEALENEVSEPARDMYYSILIIIPLILQPSALYHDQCAIACS